MGQKGFRELLQQAYFYGAQGVIAVCDSTRQETFNELDHWIESTYDVAGRIPVVVLGNKADLSDQIQVSEEDLQDYASQYAAQA